MFSLARSTAQSVPLTLHALDHNLLSKPCVGIHGVAIIASTVRGRSARRTGAIEGRVSRPAADRASLIVGRHIMQGLDLTIYQITLTITRRHPGLVKNKWGPTTDKAKHQNRNKNKSHIHSDHQSTFDCMAYVDFQINLGQRACAFAKKAIAGIGVLKVTRRSKAAPLCAAFSMVGRAGAPKGAPFLVTVTPILCVRPPGIGVPVVGLFRSQGGPPDERSRYNSIRL